MSGLQRSSSVRTTASSSTSSSSRYRNLGGTIVHKVRLDDPAFEAGGTLGIGAPAAVRKRMGSNNSPRPSSHTSSPRNHHIALGRAPNDMEQDDSSDDSTSSEGSEDDYGEAEEYPSGPGSASFSHAPSHSQPKIQGSSSAPSIFDHRKGSVMPPLPVDALQRAQRYGLERVQEQSIAEDDQESGSGFLQPPRPAMLSADSQMTIRHDTQDSPERRLQELPMEDRNSARQLASEIEKLDVLDSYARSHASDSDTRSSSSAAHAERRSNGANSQVFADAKSIVSASAASDSMSARSPRTAPTPLSITSSLPRSESTESDDVPLSARLGEDAALAIQQRLIKQDRERRQEEALRSIERGGRTGSAKEKRAAELAKQQEQKALAQAQAQIAVQQAQIQALLQAQQQLLQHAAAKQQHDAGSNSHSDALHAASAAASSNGHVSGLSRGPSNSRSIYAARQAKAAAAAAAAAASAQLPQTSGLHRAKTHGASAGVPHNAAPNAFNATRAPRRAETSNTNASGFGPGSDADLLLRAAAARSPRSAPTDTMGASPGSLGMTATSPTFQTPPMPSTDGLARKASHAFSPGDAYAPESGGASLPSSGLTPAQEIMLAAKAGMGSKASGMGDVSASEHVSSGLSAAPMSAPAPVSSSSAAAMTAVNGLVAAPSSSAAMSNAAVVASSTNLQQLRVFIVNRQRYGTLLARPDARAREVTIETLEQENVSVGGTEGGWVVWDVCPGLGIERPLREYEIISQVMGVRADSLEDYFLLKRTELAPYLALKAVPTLSPVLAGWVYVEDRKKKWAKRWLELREHSLYHAKSEKGKDEVFICSLTTFDVYLVDTGKIKTPRPHAFAIRSQNSITMFEKPDQDYVHYFCLSDPGAHRSWVRAILNARTYVLKQEQAALFKVPVIPTAPVGVVGPAGVTATPATLAPGGLGLGGMGVDENVVLNGVGPGLARHTSLSRSRSNRRPPGGGGLDAVAGQTSSSSSGPPVASSAIAAAAAAQMLEGSASKYLNAGSGGGPGGATSLARARTTSVGHHHASKAPRPSVGAGSAPTASGSGSVSNSIASATRNLFSGPFAKGSLLESMAVSGAGRNGLGAEILSSQAYKQAQTLAASVKQPVQQQQQQQQAQYAGVVTASPGKSAHHHAHHHHHQPQQQQQQGQQPLLDFSVHEKTRVRMMEEARKREMVARMRRAKEEGRPLVEEAGMRR
ncbi:unnamed protein product [Tilletia caries]|nr:unnamed protein product [Tilletia caries]